MEYRAKDINGNEVVLSEDAAARIAAAYERNDHKDTVLDGIFNYCDEEGLDAEKVSDDTIKAILDDYEDYLEGDAMDEVMDECLDNAIGNFADNIRKDCKQQKPKSKAGERSERN